MKNKILALVLTLASPTYADSVLSGNFTVDNEYTAYISTDNSTAGTQIASGNNWTATDSISNISLLDGQDYFLHVAATDWGVIPGFLGDFSIIGTDHTFYNGSSNITTDTINWFTSADQWGNYTNAVLINGSNGVSPWRLRPGISSIAKWIWGEDSDTMYFSAPIVSTSVPEPSIFLLLLMPLLISLKRFT